MVRRVWRFATLDSAVAGRNGKVPIVIPSFSSWRGSWRFLGAFALVLSTLSLAAPQAYAQQTPVQGEPAGQAPAAPAAKPQGGDSVARRIGRLEQQFLDLQVSVGTLETLLRAKPGAVLPQEAAGAAGDAASSAALGDLTSRVGALETQIGALSSQLDQIGKEMSALQAKLASARSAASLSQQAAPSPEAAPPVQPSEASPSPSPTEQTLASTAEDTSKPRWFGAPADDGPTGATPNDAPQPLAPLPPHGDAPAPSQGLTAGIPNSDAQSLYEQGYGAILQRDYGAAETAFRQLIAFYPNDPLAGSAQYWIGESYYVRGQYKSAADAFVKGYKKYKSGDKAPDTLLKLGMSLAELGQKDAACSTFGELAAKYPQAPEHILDQAKGERKKAGC